MPRELKARKLRNRAAAVSSLRSLAARPCVLLPAIGLGLLLALACAQPAASGSEASGAKARSALETRLPARGSKEAPPSKETPTSKKEPGSNEERGATLADPFDRPGTVLLAPASPVPGTIKGSQKSAAPKCGPAGLDASALRADESKPRELEFRELAPARAAGARSASLPRGPPSLRLS